MAVNWEKYKVWGSATYNLKISTILSFYFVGLVPKTNKIIVGFSELYFCLLNIYELFWELSLNTLGKTHIFTFGNGALYRPHTDPRKTHVYYLEIIDSISLKKGQYCISSLLLTVGQLLMQTKPFILLWIQFKHSGGRNRLIVCCHLFA